MTNQGPSSRKKDLGHSELLQTGMGGSGPSLEPAYSYLQTASDLLKKSEFDFLM